MRRIDCDSEYDSDKDGDEEGEAASDPFAEAINRLSRSGYRTMNYKLRRTQEARAACLCHDWGTLNWLAGAAIGNAEGLTLGRVVIRKGHRNPGHAHFNCEEALYLMKGRLEHDAGGEKVIMEAGDTIVIPAGVFHYAVSIGDQDADMIVAYSSGERDFVMAEGGEP
jgi:quercetin dioxygenase-like cupin family protein